MTKSKKTDNQKKYRQGKKLVGYWTDLEDGQDLLKLKEYMEMSTISDLLRYIVKDYVRIRVKLYHNFVQKEMYNEMETIFKDKNGSVEDRLERLLYLDTEIKNIETMKNEG